MLILLPPSEAKRAGGSGPAYPKTTQSFPALQPTRSRVIAALEAACRTDPVAATAGLKLPASVAEGALAANAHVGCGPTLPAIERYAGVVYDALDAPTLSPAARAVADDGVLIFSGLWGLLRGRDPIPDYRVPVSATLPGLGPLTPVWRGELRAVVPLVFGDHLVIDLRSTDYAAMWAATGPLRARVLPVRILRETGRGKKATRRVISYHSKDAKGRLTRALLDRAAAGEEVSRPSHVGAVAESLGMVAEPRRVTGGQVALDLVERA